MDNKTEDTEVLPVFSYVSHELRVPLSNIVGYTQLLNYTNLTTRQKIYVNSINDSCIRLLELVNDITDCAKLSSGKYKINMGPFSVQEMIDIVSNATRNYQEKKQSLKFDVSRNIPRYIIQDKSKIIQILVNLISNSIKYTPNYGVISVSLSLLNSNTIRFTVKDNGIGFDESDSEKIFKPFYQGSNQEGLGLGLAIVKKLTTILGSEICFSSKVNYGTTFWFDLKFQSYDKPTELINLYDRYVLVTDSDINIRIQIGEWILECNGKPIVTPSLKESIMIVKSKKYKFLSIIVNIDQDDTKEFLSELKNIDISTSLLGLSNHDTSIQQFPVMTKPLIKKDVVMFLDTKVRSLRSILLQPQTYEYNVLIVEDNVSNSDLLIHILDQLGCKHVYLAQSLPEAKHVLSQKDIRLIFLDIELKDECGLGLFDPDSRIGDNLDVAIVSGFPPSSVKIRCQQLGIKYFISKPYRLNQIETVLRNII